MAACLWRLVASASLLAVARGVRQAVHVPRPTARRADRRLLSALAAGLAGARGARADTSGVGSALGEMDLNGDGRVDEEEFRADIMRRIGGQEMDAERANGWVSSMSDRVAAEADLDGDGVLGEREVLFAEHLVALALNHAMYDHPADDDEFLDSRYQAYLARHDGNADGRLDRAEWKAAMREFVPHWGLEGYLDDADVVQWMDRLFERADISGDAALTAKEFHFSTVLGEADGESSMFRNRALANELLAEFDQNGDGVIDADEAVRSDRLTRLLGWADSNADGVLDRSEMAALAARVSRDS